MSIWNTNRNFLGGIVKTIFSINTHGQRNQRFPIGAFQFSSTSSNSNNNPNPPLTEAQLKTKLQASFPTATQIEIEDISGGCGAMFQIYIESPDFQGLNTVKQHQLVNAALKDEIKTMHGLRINTAATKTKP